MGRMRAHMRVYIALLHMYRSAPQDHLQARALREEEQTLLDESGP